MKFLLIADRIPLHQNLKEIILKNEPDLIITLGDLSYFDLQCLSEFNIPKIGVYGNHCQGDYMSLLRIENLHLKISHYLGISFFGFEGCVKYKDANRQYSQYEAHRLIEPYNAQLISIIISHAPPKGMNDSNINESHSGFEAIKNLIDISDPAIVFHGHTYPEEDQKISWYKNTIICHINGIEIFDMKDIPGNLPLAKSYE